jgi:hypothetical protein
VQQKRPNYEKKALNAFSLSTLRYIQAFLYQRKEKEEANYVPHNMHSMEMEKILTE